MYHVSWKLGWKQQTIQNIFDVILHNLQTVHLFAYVNKSPYHIVTYMYI